MYSELFFLEKDHSADCFRDKAILLPLLLGKSAGKAPGGTGAASEGRGPAWTSWLVYVSGQLGEGELHPINRHGWPKAQNQQNSSNLKGRSHPLLNLPIDENGEAAHSNSLFIPFLVPRRNWI